MELYMKINTVISFTLTVDFLVTLRWASLSRVGGMKNMTWD